MKVDGRRRFLRRANALAVAGALGMNFRATAARSESNGGGAMVEVKALVFDVFGTLVDWRTCVARESKKVLEPMGYKLDWIAFADAWRGEYQPAMEEIRSGALPYVKLDHIHRRMLDRIRPNFGLEKLDEPTMAELNLAWHRLDAWPGVAAGLRRLRRKYLLAPCSNGNIALMADLARHNDIWWDAILGSEIAQDYKPKPRVYLATAEAFNLRPEQVMMCAAHSSDLAAAAAQGLRTAHIAQVDEFGKGTGEAGPRQPVDVSAKNFEEFAAKMVP
ncbi:MAG TPA: haloacid dehalogenase type II [Burkholderiales bacterium]|nr:haloacid dehalogenase type II [Burkholderiales bacterium]